MSLRITQSILFSQALSSIQNGLLHYTQLQEQVSTGRRVNRPSDDPAAALRIIPLTNDLRNLDQLDQNVNLARETLNTGASALEDASTLMQRVRELTVQAANATVSDADRNSMGAEVDQLLHQLVGIGNSKRGDRYLFGGTASGSTPFTLVEDSSGDRVLYNGNHQSLSVEVAPGVQTALNVPGDSIFQHRNRGATTFSDGHTGARPTNLGDTGVGYQTLAVTFNGLHTDRPSTVTVGTGNTTALGVLGYQFTAGPPATLSVGGGPAVNIPASNSDFTTSSGAVINLSVTGVPTTLSGTFTAKAGLSTDGGATVTDVSDFGSTSTAVHNAHDGSVLNVDVTQLRAPGSEVVKFAGTFDAFTVLVSLRDLLHNQSTLPTQEVQRRLSSLLGEIDSAHESVLDGVRELGFRSSSMDLLQSRVGSLRASGAEALSQVQDTDMAAAILALQRQDISYQAALQVGARAIQTSLQGFLR